MNILVTGGSGFIGSHTAKFLSDRGHTPIILARNPDKAERVLQAIGCANYRIAPGDVCDADSVARALEGCQGLVHTAAFVSTSSKDIDRIFATNVQGTVNVIGLAVDRGLQHIVHVSSTAALYSPEYTSLTGHEPLCAAKSSYGQSKAEAEAFVRDLQSQGAPVSIAYPAGVIGPGDPGLSEPHQALQIFLQKTGITTSSGFQFADVRDTAQALCVLLESATPPQRMPIGGHYLPWKALLLLLESVTGRKLFALPIPGPLLRGLGHLGDLFTAITGQHSTINSEGMLYGTKWVKTDDSEALKLGVHFRDPQLTLHDALLSMARSGQLTARQIGRLNHEL